MKLENLELTDGIFKFEQETPGENLKVTFSGYKIREDQNADNLHVLLDTTAETTASIYWITPVIETVPTVAQEFEIGTRLKDIKFTRKGSGLNRWKSYIQSERNSRNLAMAKS